MKKALLISISLLFSITIIAQTSIVGKKFEAEVENTCAKMKGGGCTTIKNCILAFEKDSVNITFPYLNDCWLDEKHSIENGISKPVTYAWTKRRDKVFIKNFVNFEEFIFKNDKLIIEKQGKKYEFLQKNRKDGQKQY